MAPKRVEVIYFPKKTEPRKRSHTETPSAPDPSATRTIEFRPFAEDEVPTEPVAPHPAKPQKKRTRSGERRVTLEIDTDPALRYHVQKLGELFNASAGAQVGSLDRVELAQMAMFGHQLFEAGRLEEARVVFEGLVALDVKDAFPHTMLGTVYLALGLHDRAVALFEAALALDPEDVAARVYRAEIRIHQKRLRPAIAELTAVLRKGPADDPFVQRATRLLEIAREQARRKRR